MADRLPTPELTPEVNMPRTLGRGARLLALALALQTRCAAAADDEFARELATRTIVVGVKQAPPFAIKEADGYWSGISIELWKRVAAELHLQYRLVEEQTVQALIDNVTSGKVDVAVAALTVTADRERNMDFAQPFFSTGLGVAVRTDSAISWAPGCSHADFVRIRAGGSGTRRVSVDDRVRGVGHVVEKNPSVGDAAKQVESQVAAFLGKYGVDNHGERIP